MKQSDDNKFIPMTSVSSGKGRELRSNLFYYTNQIVNVIFHGDRNTSDWVMIDAGMPKSGPELLRVAEERYGKRKPAALILTHGHFDHVGGIVDLIKNWGVQVYAHPFEFPYLCGLESYPEPDATVEGGMLAKISSIYPNEPINIREVLKPLPQDGTVPGMDGWRWIHTPGHTPGHVSLFHDSDKILIAGDAITTVRADAFYKVLMQKEEVNGPPRYLTTDWSAAYSSVVKLANLHPEIMITGHGQEMHGKELAEGLEKLVRDFETMAKPSHGKFV